jgi:hypothetical protein
MYRLFILLFVFVEVAVGTMQAQLPLRLDTLNGYYLVETVVIDGDTIPVVTLRTTTISSQRKARSIRHQRKWDKLHANVVKTYPYAKVAGELIQAYNDELHLLETEAERVAYMDKCEEDLKAEFEGDLRTMTTSQGRVLIKLIDRETGKTGYDLIRELKSGFTAFMWQGVARLFGTDLKDAYNPDENEYDAMIEEIVDAVERGEIAVNSRPAKTTAAQDALREKSKRLQRRIEREKRRLNKKN